jgi:pimeloyl-ACP methyl ester carboxylesterase
LCAADQADVAARVAAAKRILLFIHGIVGGPPLPPVAMESYDLLLTFDYEYINTSIEETARQLKQRLADVGLGAGHHKTLHVVAHSMGGLVARWTIEREGGAGLVQHLVMLGTPNAGSPWPTVHDWATRALAIGLNALGGGAWPATVLGGLVAAIEQVDVALDQMAPGAPILETLAESPYPGAGVRYSVIAGDTRRIWERQADIGRLARLLDRVSGHRLLHDVTAQAFFGQPNDIAVSVDSSTHLPKHWPTQPATHVIACDHVTYFSTEESVKLLATLLAS